MRIILRDFWNFLKKPHSSQLPEVSTFKKTLHLFLALFVIRLISLVLEINAFRPLIRHLTGSEVARQYHSFDAVDFVVSALLIAPLVEEAAYRLGLRFHPVQTAISLGLVAFYWLPFGGTYSYTSLLSVAQLPGFYLMVFVSSVVGLTAYALFKIPYVGSQIAGKWNQQFGWIFYISSLLFGLMHVFNVREITWAVVVLAPVITFQQLVFGLFNGYVRMRYGFIQAVIQHALFNLLPVLIRFWS
ncbi:CPBP family glutamic-type intramembrane protease [Arundinibacter roseus]|uniref:CPBP family intramembrane metalloprotease n=1 Tax=Arundinibacter roseus TaxID=2070510 RepID=A0A4R4KDD2_9BACT|nr:CPBP family glutamic-type intramembrane protease [Arundinibacter roseus]TDB65880.1 CPBP family intramembrane metalloprotease [Arundinibacter roseus]